MSYPILYFLALCSLFPVPMLAEDSAVLHGASTTRYGGAVCCDSLSVVVNQSWPTSFVHYQDDVPGKPFAEVCNSRLLFPKRMGPQTATGSGQLATADRPLSCFEWFAVLAFTALDSQLLGRYTRSALSNPQRRHYGTLKLAVHYVGGMVSIGSGLLAMGLQVLGNGKFSFLVTLFARMLGVTALVGAVGASLMARYTQGHEGFLLICYVEYAFLWAWSAVNLLTNPTPHATYACWTLGHAYATCRVCVAAINKALKHFKWSYTIGTSLASASVIVLVLDTPTAVTYLVFYFAIAFLLGSQFAKIHVNASRKQGREFRPFTYYNRM